MAKQFIREVKPHAKMYKDTNSGIAWIEDGSTGCGHSCHPNIDASGSVRGMKDLGYWGKKDRTVRSHGFIYNIDSFVIDKTCVLDRIVAEECSCQGCKERRMKKGLTVSDFIKEHKIEGIVTDIDTLWCSEDGIIPGWLMSRTIKNIQGTTLVVY